MNKFYNLVEEICRQDKRYKPDAYEFVLQGLSFTQKKLKKNSHINGAQLAVGLRDYAVNQYGPLAKQVLVHWGIRQTRDFGNIVFNMIEKRLLAKTKDDSISDFEEIYDFDKVFSNILAESIMEGMKSKA